MNTRVATAAPSPQSRAVSTRRPCLVWESARRGQPFPILANRLDINGEVRRLGFAPIPSRRFNSNPGAFRGERAARKIIDAQKLEISRDRKPGQKRVEALPGSCASLCDGTARRSRAGVMTGRARNYVDEFAFRLNDGNVKRHTMERLESFVSGTKGKRLTYKALIQ